MKKIIAIAVLGTITLASCSKDYTCTYEVLDEEVVVEYTDLDSDEAEAAETSCDAVDGTWATK